MPEQITLTVNGKNIAVPLGATVAVAMAMAGVPCRRSVSGEPRGPLCGMGICFVSQRCFEDFSTSRLQSISRVSFVLSGVGLLFTTMGVILGMAWAKTTWGRYWSWDVKEIGGLCVIVWLVSYLLAHRFFKSSARGILTISMLGNIVVSLAWFGPQLNGLHQ